MKNLLFQFSLLLLIACYAILPEAKAAGINSSSADSSYVVQVKTHNNLKVIESAKKSLMAKYPDKKFVIRTHAPNYILMIGYFKTKAEAEEFKKLVEKDYPG